MDLYQNYVPQEVYSYINIISFLISGYILLFEKNGLLFFIFISYIVVSELFIGQYLMLNTQSNISFYNFYSVGCVCWYLLIFGTYIFKYEQIILFPYLKVTANWVLFVVLNFIMNDFENSIIIKSYLFGLFIVTLYGFVILKMMLDTKINPFRDSIFYLTIGTSLFFSACFTSLIFINDIFSISEKLDDSVVLRAKAASGVVMNFGNIILSLGYLGMVVCSSKRV